MLKDLIMKNRSYRRFYQEKKITDEVMVELVEAGHMTPSGANKQPVRFVIVNSVKNCEKVYDTLRWAGYYKDWDGPIEGEGPSAYVIMMTPENVNCQWDEGIIGQSILLAAVEKNMGGCFIANIDKKHLYSVVSDMAEIPDNYTVSLVIALGYPKEEVVIENIDKDGDIVYYRDEKQVHHVPKIKTEDVIIGKG